MISSKQERRGGGRCRSDYEDKCFSTIQQRLPQLMLGCAHIYHTRYLGRYRQTNKQTSFLPKNVTFGSYFFWLWWAKFLSLRYTLHIQEIAGESHPFDLTPYAIAMCTITELETGLDNILFVSHCWRDASCIMQCLIQVGTLCPSLPPICMLFLRI